MRTTREFLDAYRKLVPNPELFRGGRNSDVALVDLALHLLTQFLPDEPVGVIPFLLSGYPGLAGNDPKMLRAIQNLRHYCASFSSPYAWGAAMEIHADIPDVNRAYRVDGGVRPRRREAASDALLDLLETTIHQSAPHVIRKISLAKPGPARVHVDHRKTRLDYVIPVYREDKIGCKQHDLVRRSHNPPIAVRWSALTEVAREIDRAEVVKGWTTATGLQPLNLANRLDKIRLRAIDKGLFRDEILTIEGVRHLVGMLSSGKSTLVMALLFTLARPEYGKRILVLSPDTTAAALLSARLKAHGIVSTVLSSFQNRDEHLSSIHWHQAMTRGSGWSMTGIGRLVSDFGVACPLDGHQVELRAVTGVDHGELRFPLMSEKACHQIEQETGPGEGKDKPDDVEAPIRQKPKRSCPLFSGCPAQSQQRTAVDAQVIVMTAPAFLMMQPDPNVLSESMSFPELVQFNRDLVIVDEADAVQRTLDEHFAVPAPIMGGEGSYLPQSALSVHAALQQQGGAQYASRLNVAWQIRLSRLEVAVSGLYSLLLNRWDDMSGFNLESEFTAATIFCRLWKARADKIRGEKDFRLTGETEVAFQKILAMAGTLAMLDEPDPMARDDERSADGTAEARAPHPETQTLLELRAKLRNGVSWRSLLDETILALNGHLREFNTFEHQLGTDAKRLMAREQNALAILAALYANIVLSSFNFLVRNQAAVSAAFQLEEYTLLDETRNLMRQYRALVPESPGGNAFGLVYEHKRHGDTARGDLKLVSNLGVGRYLLTNLHALLQHENQAGPHVLLLSGTSWAGGKMTMGTPESIPSNDIAELPKALRSVSVASPSYDVQVPVAGYLDQPDREREELKHSRFELVPVPGEDGKALSVSGLTPETRRLNLQRIAQHLAVETGGHTRIEWQWMKNDKTWGSDRMQDRRRSLFIVQSYSDAVVVANAIRRQIDIGMAPRHQVYALVNDKDIRTNASKDAQFRLTSGVMPLPRSLVEDFGSSPEGAILVVPLVLIARGHNILNKNNVAAVSTIYFLHRPHPRPDDRSGIVGQVNRFALDCLQNQVSEIRGGTVLQRGRLQRYLARMISRRALSARGGYSMMPEEEQARFAWDLITPLWQTIGRGIRGGAPIYVGFVDAKFSPGRFEGDADTPHKSCLLQALEQLRNALNPAINSESEIADKLYGPLYECLEQMFLHNNPAVAQDQEANTRPAANSDKNEDARWPA